MTRPAGYPLKRAPSMRLPARSGAQQRGFTLFELFVVILIFSVLIGYLLDKVFDNLEIAEKSAMETQRMMMRAGMDLHIAGMITAGRERDLPRLRGSNPVEWLREPPANYLGAFPAEPKQAGEDGGWFFDTTAREIVYTPKRNTHLKPGQDGRYRVRFHVVASSVKGRSNGEVAWPVLVPVEPYAWFK